MHEIVTLQFGQRANYLATHFWNTQESYFIYAPNTEPSIVDHDINFRPGIGTDGSDTYTPRTIIYDLKGGFGTLKQQNALYDDTPRQPNAPAVWNSNGLTTIKQQPIEPISYQQDLDAGLPTSQLHKSQIRYWSDFSRVFFHPRSIVQLNEYSLNSSIAPFENWSAGEELFRDVDREADLLDRDVRTFAEECDSMQGFQVFAGSDDAWGGWTSRYIDALRDEYGKKSIWIYGIEDNRRVQREKVLLKKANVAKTFSDVNKYASAYVMLATQPAELPRYLTSDLASEWESSALMATAVESATLPTRLRSTTNATNRSTMQQYEQFLISDEGRNIWDLGLRLDQTDAASADSGGDDNQSSRANANRDSSQIPQDQSVQEEQAATMDITFTPTTSHLLSNTTRRSHLPSHSHSHTFTQILTSRHSKTRPPTRTHPSPPHKTTSHLHLRPRPTVQSHTIPLAFPLLDAYPTTLFTPPSPTTHMLPLASALSTTSATKHTLVTLRDLVLATRHGHAIALDEREELYDALTAAAERYTYGWEGDDEEDWGSGED